MAKCLYYPRPEPFFAPLAVPTVERAVRPKLLFWRSRHEEPLSMIHKIPQSTCRSSRLGRPSPGFCLGNNSLTRSHWSSLRSPDALSARRGVLVDALPSPEESAGARGDVPQDHHRGRRRRILPGGLPRGALRRRLVGSTETATIPAETPFALRDPSSRGSTALPPVWWAGSVRGRNASLGPPFSGAFLIFGDRAHHRQVGMGEQAKRDVTLPAIPLPYLVLVEADLPLAAFEDLLPAPTTAPSRSTVFAASSPWSPRACTTSEA